MYEPEMHPSPLHGRFQSRSCDFHAQQLAVVSVEHVARAKPAAVGQYVTRKVERPASIGDLGHS